MQPQLSSHTDQPGCIDVSAAGPACWALHPHSGSTTLLPEKTFPQESIVFLILSSSSSVGRSGVTVHWMASQAWEEAMGACGGWRVVCSTPRFLEVFPGKQTSNPELQEEAAYCSPCLMWFHCPWINNKDSKFPLSLAPFGSHTGSYYVWKSWIDF